MVIEWLLVAIGVLSFVTLMTGMGATALCAALDLWADGRFVERFFAVLIGTLGMLLMTPLILSIYLIIYQCVNAISAII